ncbi:MAG TPA: copper-binding protein [Alphaproteobacteria bacterium]|nr:copper-binding protein [Alphaproteobacteria bacterium]
MRSFIAAAAIAFVSVPSLGHAVKGQILDPAIHGLIRLEPLEFGSETDISHMAPREYRLKVGQGYRWKIKASDLQEYAFTAPAFFRNIWICKIEVEDGEIKSPTLDEIEFEQGGEPELFFVAIRPGTYDYGSRGLMERGMVGKIIVESGDEENPAN